jgi:hypothetical protein
MFLGGGVGREAQGYKSNQELEYRGRKNLFFNLLQFIQKITSFYYLCIIK